MNASDLSEGLGICDLRNKEPQWAEGRGIYKDGKMNNRKVWNDGINMKIEDKQSRHPSLLTLYVKLKQNQDKESKID